MSFVLQVNDSQSESSSESEGTKKGNELKSKSEDLDYLVSLMKDKLKTNLSRHQKIQILTIAPKSWSRRKVAEEFDVSEYLVRKARALTSEKGTLALPEPKQGRKIPQETIDIAVSYTHLDVYKRQVL